MNTSSLTEFEQKLTFERTNTRKAYGTDLIGDYTSILHGISLDYVEFERHSRNFLEILKSNNPHSLAYSVNVFFERFADLLLNCAGQTESGNLTLYLAELKKVDNASPDIWGAQMEHAYDSGFAEYGYLHLFEFHTNSNRIHAAFLFANLSMTYALRKAPPYPAEYLKLIFWQGVQLFRCLTTSNMKAQICKEIPETFQSLDYDKTEFDRSYFDWLLNKRDIELPGMLQEYLTVKHSDILSSGSANIINWYTILSNVKELYPTTDFSMSLSDFYIAFKKAVADQITAN